MRRMTLGIAGALLTSALAGCSEPAAQDEAVPVQRSNAEQFNALKGQMDKAVKSDAHTKKPGDLEGGDTKPAPVDMKPAPAPADTKSAPAPPAKAVDTKTPEKKP